MLSKNEFSRISLLVLLFATQEIQQIMYLNSEILELQVIEGMYIVFTQISVIGSGTSSSSRLMRFAAVLRVNRGSKFKVVMLRSMFRNFQRIVDAGFHLRISLCCLGRKQCRRHVPSCHVFHLCDVVNKSKRFLSSDMKIYSCRAQAHFFLLHG